MSTDLSKTRPNSSFAMSEVTDDYNHDNDWAPKYELSSHRCIIFLFWWVLTQTPRSIFSRPPIKVSINVNLQ
jgi:hypothetical protein